MLREKGVYRLILNGLSIGLFSGILLINACKTGGSTGEPGHAPDQDEDQKVGEKISHYISCLNSLSQEIFSSRQRYHEWIEKNQNFDKEGLVYGLYQLNHVDSGLESLNQGLNMAPKINDMDQAATAYRDAVLKLAPLVKKAHYYYTQQNYRDDNFEQGKAMHEPLVAAFSEFAQVNNRFDSMIRKTNQELKARHLAQLEKDPDRRLEYLQNKLMQEAQLVIEQTDIATLEELKYDPFVASIKAYETALLDLQAYRDEHKKLSSCLSTMLSNAEKYLKAAKDLARRKTEKKDFNTEFFSKSNPKLVEGHPAQLIERYNDLVNAFNHFTIY